KYPDVFGVVSMYAPPLQTLEGFQQEAPQMATDVWDDSVIYFRDCDPYNLVEQNADQIRGRTKIRLWCGSNDRYKVLAEDFHARLDELKIDHEFKIIPGGKHNLGQML